ncbi:MAG TPA: hypothetical protein VH107_14440, partial [Lacipirellulaceae bacterium]|nr:hypothetical protein [Lacipirellulaceae bacterium]
MQEFTIEAALSEKLGQRTGQAVLCDSAGRALGFFSPMRDRPMVKDLQLEPPWTIEESKERCKERTGKPLAEILKRLG